VLLSDPVIIYQLTLISVDGVDTIEGLVGKKVRSTLSLYETTQSMYADLASGRIDVIVDTFPPAQAALALTPVEGAASVVPAPDERELSTTKPGQTNFPVNLDNPALSSTLNERTRPATKQGGFFLFLLRDGWIMAVHTC
jgi:ABC-type amino acid transport substrate-binding protein